MGTEKYVLGLFIDKQRGVPESNLRHLGKNEAFFLKRFSLYQKEWGFAGSSFLDPGGQDIALSCSHCD